MLLLCQKDFFSIGKELLCIFLGYWITIYGFIEAIYLCFSVYSWNKLLCYINTELIFHVTVLYFCILCSNLGKIFKLNTPRDCFEGWLSHKLRFNCTLKKEQLSPFHFPPRSLNHLVPVVWLAGRFIQFNP